MNKKNYLGEALLYDKVKTKYNLKLKENSVTTDKIADGAITSDKISDKSITASKIDDDILQGLIEILKPKILETIIDGVIDPDRTVDITSYDINLELGLSHIYDEDDNFDTFRTIKGGQYLIVDNSNREEETDKDVVTGYMMVFKDHENSTLTEVIHSNYDVGKFTSSLAQYTIQYRIWSDNHWGEWKLFSSGTITPIGYSITYNANGHGTTPNKVTNAAKLPSSLPTLSTSGYAFEGWYTDAALTTKAVAGSTLTSDITLYAKWVVAYTVTYVNNGHGSTPSKLSNVTKLPSSLPTLSASGYTFGGWYTDSGLTTKAVAGSVLTSNVTLYAKWTEVPKLYMYTGNTATTPTESEILQGTKYDYGTTKKFSTPIMELRSIWVCLPKTVTLVSMRNTSFSEFIYDTSTEVNYMNSKAITINEVQYILYYLTTIPSKCPYETIVK